MVTQMARDARTILCRDTHIFILVRRRAVASHGASVVGCCAPRPNLRETHGVWFKFVQDEIAGRAAAICQPLLRLKKCGGQAMPSSIVLRTVLSEVIPLSARVADE